nr:Chain 1, Nascent chain [Oryctolagus cuniculus]5LZZ_1 Chain 1, Nascent chain [Oryctolagus cuniculus]
DSPGLKV